MVELLMVALSVPAGGLGWGLGVLLRRQREVGAHECGESVESVSERVRPTFMGSQFAPPSNLWYK